MVPVERACATSRSRTSSPTSAARSTRCWRWRRGRSRSAVRSRRWSPSRTSPTAPPRALADGEILSIGKRRLRWFDAPHVPHGWETGFLFEETTRTLLCGDLFTQGGTGEAAADRVRHPRTERGLPGSDGLLLALEEGRSRSWSASRPRADDPRLHARQRLARRREGTCFGSSRAPWRRRPPPAQRAEKRLPGESIGTPFRHSGHSASGQDGTESASSERDGTAKAPGRQAPVHDRPDGDDAPAGRLDRRGRLAGGLARREDVLDDDDRLPRLEREARAAARKTPSLRSTNIAGSSSARAVSCPMTTPPSAGDTTARAPNSAQLLPQPPPRLLRPLRPHQAAARTAGTCRSAAPTTAESARSAAPPSPRNLSVRSRRGFYGKPQHPLAARGGQLRYDRGARQPQKHPLARGSLPK